MTFRLLASSAFAALAMSVVPPFVLVPSLNQSSLCWAQKPKAAVKETDVDESAPENEAPENEASEDEGSPKDSAKGDSAKPADATETKSPSAEDLQNDPEYQAEVAKRSAEFAAAQERLAEAIGKQREIYVRYVNFVDRTKKAEEEYRAQREVVRGLLNETYSAALNLSRVTGDIDAATYIVTLVQHRLDNDIYDLETLEGATRMIDAGSNLVLLYRAAARSAIVTGQFDLANRLYAAIEDEHKEDIDKAFQYNLDQFKEQYEQEQAIRKKEAEEDQLPRVKLATTQGDVIIELFLDQAPSAVSHFIQLVEQHFYDDLDFYQVIKHLLALTGDTSGTGSGHSGKFLVDERDREDARPALRGSLLMAMIPKPGENGEFIDNSASSQFAILFLPVVSVKGQQTVFGRVIEGMDAICRLQRIDPSKKKEKGEIVFPPDRVLEATVIRRPETLPEPVYAGQEHRETSPLAD